MSSSRRHRPRIGAARTIAALGVAAAIALVPIAPAMANISTELVRGDVGLSFRYAYDNGPAWSLAYPYRMESVGGERTLAYCVQWPIGTEDGALYDEGEWDGIENLANVNWILHNGAPVVSNAELTDAVEAHSGLTLTDFSDYEARGGTQFAIWSYTDGFEMDRVLELYEQVGGGGSLGSVQIPRVSALVAYLTDPAINVGMSEPVVSLALEDSAAAWNGTEYGPIRVLTNAPEVQLEVTAGDARLVDASGAAVATATDGAELFLTSPVGASGLATISAEAPEATLSTGRLLLSPELQTLIVSSEFAALAVDTLDVELTPQLAETGTGVVPVAAGAAVLLLGGLVLLMMRTRARWR